MQGLDNPNPAHKIRSEFLASLWFSHLMPKQQVDTMIENKLAEIEKFLVLIDEFTNCECSTMPNGAQFVAGFGKHMASSFKEYIEDNRAMLAAIEKEEPQSATG